MTTRLVRVAAMLGALALGGCLQTVPHSTTTRLGRTKAPLVVDSVRPLELSTRLSPTTAIVTARWPRKCRRDVVDTIEVAEWDSIRVLGTSDGDVWGYAMAAGLVIVWPVGLAVGAASVVKLGAQPPRSRTTTRTTERVAVERRSCPLHAARLPVQLTLPSGEIIDGVTDESGTAVFLLPPGEEGMVVAAAGAGAPAPDDPALRTPPAGPRPDARLAQLMRTAESRAWARDCSTVRIIGDQVRAIDARYFAESFSMNPLIARCAR